MAYTGSNETTVSAGKRLTGVITAFNGSSSFAVNVRGAFNELFTKLPEVATRTAVLELTSKNGQFNEELEKSLVFVLREKGLSEGAVLVLDESGIPHGYAALKLVEGQYVPVTEDKYLAGRVKKALTAKYTYEKGPGHDGNITSLINKKFLAEEVGIIVGTHVFAGAIGEPFMYKGDPYFFAGGNCFLPEGQIKELLRDMPKTPKLDDPKEAMAGWQEERLARDVYAVMSIRERIRGNPALVANLS